MFDDQDMLCCAVRVSDSRLAAHACRSCQLETWQQSFCRALHSFRSFAAACSSALLLIRQLPACCYMLDLMLDPI